MSGETVRQIVGFRESEALNVALRELEWVLDGRPEHFRTRDRFVMPWAVGMMRNHYGDLTGDIWVSTDKASARRFAESVAAYARTVEPGVSITGGYRAYLKKNLSAMVDTPEVMRANLIDAYSQLAASVRRSAGFEERKEQATSLLDLAARAGRISHALVKYRLLFKPARLRALMFLAQLLRSDDTVAYGERMLRSIGLEGLDKPKFPANFDDLTAAITGYNWDHQGIVIMDEVPGTIRRGPRGNRGGAPQTPPASEPPVVPPAATPAGSAPPPATGHAAPAGAVSRIVGAAIDMGGIPIRVPQQFQSAGMQVTSGCAMAIGMPQMLFPPAFAPLSMQASGLALHVEGLAE